MKREEDQKPKQTRLEWMYDPGAAHAEKSDLDLMNEAVQFRPIKATSSSSVFMQDTTKVSSDTFRRLREDPLLAIKQKELHQRQQLVNNPLIRERVKESLKRELNLEPRRNPADGNDRERSRERFERPRKDRPMPLSKDEQDRRLREMLREGKARDTEKATMVKEYTNKFK